jgi:hypothetical protein
MGVSTIPKVLGRLHQLSSTCQVLRSRAEAARGFRTQMSSLSGHRYRAKATPNPPFDVICGYMFTIDDLVRFAHTHNITVPTDVRHVTSYINVWVNEHYPHIPRLQIIYHPDPLPPNTIMTNNFPPKEFIRPLLITRRTTAHRSDFVFNENARDLRFKAHALSFGLDPSMMTFVYRISNQPQACLHLCTGPSANKSTSRLTKCEFEITWPCRFGGHLE